MDYEQKYKKALARAKEYHVDGIKQCIIDTLEYIFPELKESEDDRMRKGIIQTLKRYVKCVEEGHGVPSAKDFLVKDTEKQIAWLEKQTASIDVDSILNKVGVQPACKDGNAWSILYGDNLQDGICGFGDTKEDALVEFIKELLEKQGEQKSIDKSNTVDKLKPKFKVNDWITDGYVGGKITSIDDNYPCYKIADFMGGIDSPIPFTVQDNYHLWTIDDAKDGDVLATKWGAFIVKEYLDIINPDGVIAYCGINSMGRFDKCDGIYPWTDEKITPATKEQRELLFQKMKEVGYEWDANKKELRKLLL